jgi:hypothetical protein
VKRQCGWCAVLVIHQRRSAISTPTAPQYPHRFGQVGAGARSPCSSASPAGAPRCRCRPPPAAADRCTDGAAHVDDAPAPPTHPRASHAPLLPTPSPSVARRPAPRSAPCCPIVGILPLLTVGADRWRGAGQVLARRRREARDRTRRLFGLAPAQQGARRRRTKQGDADGGGGGGVAVAAAAVRRLPPSLDPGAGLR